MVCPNCANIMRVNKFDNQNILHCDTCGGSFFEANSINRISLETAEVLSDDKASDSISGQEKHCPKDHNIIMMPITNEKSIPYNVSLLKCSKCKGVFAYPDDLINFKRAQKAKIDFFKLWDRPLPSLQAVLVFSFVAIVSVSALVGFMTLSNGSASQTQAGGVIKKVYFANSGPYLFVNFITNTPFRSEIIFNDKTTKQLVKKTVSDSLTTRHSLTTSDVNPTDDLYYQIILTDARGNSTITKEQKVEIK